MSSVAFSRICEALLTSLLISTTPSTGLAQVATPAACQVELGLYGGWSWLSADNQLGNAPDPTMRPGGGGVFGGRGSLSLSPALAVEAEVDYTLATFGDSGLAAGVLGWRALALWHVANLDLGGTPLRPFVVVGVGGESLVWQEYGTEFDTDIAVHVGVGAKLDLSERYGVRVDARYVGMDGAKSALSHSFQLLFGLTMRPAGRSSSRPRPLSHSRVQVHKPRSSPPAAKVLPRHAVALAPLDSDNDGIVDKLDKCPRRAGPTNLKNSNQHGCPPPDADKDGIPDSADKCPNEAETYNGVKDDDGCPDGKHRVIVTDRGVDTAQRIYFEAGKSTIQRRSYGLLDSVAAVMRAHMELTLIAIEGHTDDLGEATDNQKLSRARAEAVMAYLVGKGVAKKRLVARGFGATRPRCQALKTLLKQEAANRVKIVGCRERNRRVEFLVREVDGKPRP